MLKIIVVSLFSLGLGLFLIFLGIIALISPQKIVDFNLKRLRKIHFRTAWQKRLQERNIIKSEQGDYAANWRKSGVVIIFIGLIYIYALIKYLMKMRYATSILARVSSAGQKRCVLVLLLL